MYTPRMIHTHRHTHTLLYIDYILCLVLMGVAGCVWGGGDWVSVDRRLFHRCGASVDLELSCLKTLLSLEVNGSSEGILYDEIYIFCMCI